MSRYRVDGMDTVQPNIIADVEGAYATYREASVAVLDHQHRKLAEAELALMWFREQARAHAKSEPLSGPF